MSSQETQDIIELSLNLTICHSMNMLLGVNLNLDRNGRVMLDRITGHVLAGVLVV